MQAAQMGSANLKYGEVWMHEGREGGRSEEKNFPPSHRRPPFCEPRIAFRVRRRAADTDRREGADGGGSGLAGFIFGKRENRVPTLTKSRTGNFALTVSSLGARGTL